MESAISFAPLRPTDFVNFAGRGKACFSRGGAACFSAGRGVHPCSIHMQCEISNFGGALVDKDTYLWLLSSVSTLFIHPCFEFITFIHPCFDFWICHFLFIPILNLSLLFAPVFFFNLSLFIYPCFEFITFIHPCFDFWICHFLFTPVLNNIVIKIEYFVCVAKWTVSHWDNDIYLIAFLCSTTFSPSGRAFDLPSYPPTPLITFLQP